MSPPDRSYPLDRAHAPDGELGIDPAHCLPVPRASVWRNSRAGNKRATGPNPVEAINVTPAYLFRKVGDDAAKPTILFDEIDTVFGPKAKENEEFAGY